MKGFSRDGYIIDQNQLAAYPYHSMTSDINGCGWVAAYNLRRAMGQDVDFDEVRRDMDAMFHLPIPGPTPVHKLRKYLDRHLRYRFVGGRRAALEAAERSAAGILRYWEGRTPHFITFIRAADGRYRFLNVCDGQEDTVQRMDTFFARHCRGGYIRVLVTDRETALPKQEKDCC